jgi:hypothetical protein
MLPHDAGGDNPKDAVMPIRASRHYAGVIGRVVVFIHPLLDLRYQRALDVLACAILTIEAFCELGRLAAIVAQKQPERLERSSQASGGVDAGSEAKADIASAQGRMHVGDRHQCGESANAFAPSVGGRDERDAVSPTSGTRSAMVASAMMSDSPEIDPGSALLEQT